MQAKPVPRRDSEAARRVPRAAETGRSGRGAAHPRGHDKEVQEADSSRIRKVTAGGFQVRSFYEKSAEKERRDDNGGVRARHHAIVFLVPVGEDDRGGDGCRRGIRSRHRDRERRARGGDP